jgi:DNA-binding NtrC family response regulator
MARESTTSRNISSLPSDYAETSTPLRLFERARGALTNVHASDLDEQQLIVAQKNALLPCSPAADWARHLRLTQNGIFVEKSGMKSAIWGASPVMRSIFDILWRVSDTRLNVMIEGERGTGKKLMAEFIHRASHSPMGKFVIVDCRARSPEVIRRQLFGARIPARGDKRSRKGALENADGGTLLLIAPEDLPKDVQGALVRALERRPSSDGSHVFDVRTLCTSRRNLRECVDRGELKPALFHVLSHVRIRVPPLRERREDLPLLVDALRANSDVWSQLPLSPEEWQSMTTHHWPGNVHELRRMLMSKPKVPKAAQ